MMDNWTNRVGDLIGEDVEIVIGEEHVATVVRSISVRAGRGATYELAGDHQGWKVLATATMLKQQDGPHPYRADGDIEVRLIWSWQPNAERTQ